MVLKPRPLIFSRSVRQVAAEAVVTGSSMGARDLPPLYQTATGKKSPCPTDAAPRTLSRKPGQTSKTSTTAKAGREILFTVVTPGNMKLSECCSDECISKLRGG